MYKRQAIQERVNALNAVILSSTNDYQDEVLPQVIDYHALARDSGISYTQAELDEESLKSRLDKLIEAKDSRIRILADTIRTRQLFPTVRETGLNLLAILLRRARATARYTYTVAPEGKGQPKFSNYLINPGDIIFLNDEEMGFENTKVIVTQVTINNDWSLSFEAIEYSEDFYSNLDLPNLPLTPRVLAPPPDETLPDAPTGVTASLSTTDFDLTGAVIGGKVTISWDKPTDNLAHRVEIISSYSRTISNLSLIHI